MTVTSHILSIVASALVLVVVVELLRRRRLRERHAVWWFAAGVLALVVSVFPALLTGLADALGVEVPTNLVFFVSIAVLFLVCLQSSAELTRAEERIRVLAERVGILDARVRMLESGESPAPRPAGDEDRPERR